MRYVALVGGGDLATFEILPASAESLFSTGVSTTPPSLRCSKAIDLAESIGGSEGVGGGVGGSSLPDFFLSRRCDTTTVESLSITERLCTDQPEW